MSYEEVILVDAKNREIGTMEKLEAHEKGVLHRAFSIFIFNDLGEMLIQRRALEKYHCPGMWSNACCSHPRKDEAQVEALTRKMVQEMGFTVPVEKAFDFTYRAELDNGLIEYEFDEVYVGNYEGHVNPNPEEVCEYRYESIENIRRQIQQNPSNFTPWFRLLFEPIVKHYSLLRRA